MHMQRMPGPAWPFGQGRYFRDRGDLHAPCSRHDGTALADDVHRLPRRDANGSAMTAPYILHYSPSTASMAVHWMLIHLGAPFELVEVDIDGGAQNSAAYRKLNPAGRVPTLIVD